MVNRGASRACLTCKARRIGCDEGRPVCMKCTKSRRTCLGYNEEAGVSPDRDVVNIRNSRHSAPSHQVAESRSLWKTVASEHDPMMHNALTEFFLDFVLIPNNRSVSRGYFDGIDNLLVTVGQDSPLIGATRLVATVHAADTSGHTNLLERARSQYASVLMIFQKSLSDPARCNTDEALMTAAMLGLYEMVTSEEASPDAYSAHVKGLAAILYTRESSPNALPGVRLFQSFNSFRSSVSSPATRIPSFFSPRPCLDTIPPTRSLDTLMLRMRPLLLRANSLLASSQTSKADLNSLKQEVILLNKEFSLWPLLQPKEWEPQTLGYIEKTMQSSNEDPDSVPFWPGKIDSYYDLYVVAVWDTYRKSRLKLLQVILDCSERLDSMNQIREEGAMHQRLQREARGLANDLCASIPFHLAADLHSCLGPINDLDKLNIPGKALGGLLLMYPLYIASTLSLVPLVQRAWMKGRLRWIGKYMGIRQATMLANVNYL